VFKAEPPLDKEELRKTLRSRGVDLDTCPACHAHDLGFSVAPVHLLLASADWTLTGKFLKVVAVVCRLCSFTRLFVPEALEEPGDEPQDLPPEPLTP
jgi:hypothetical protein